MSDEESQRKFFDFDLMLLRERYNVPDGWEVYQWDRKNWGTPNEYTVFSGAVVTAVYKAGPRKGKKNWAKANRTFDMSLPITDTESLRFRQDWSRTTGQCYKCHGNGTAWKGWSAAEGNKYGHCVRCDGTGRAVLEATP